MDPAPGPRAVLPGPLETPWGGRLVRAVPHAVVAVYFLRVFATYVSSGMDLTPETYHLSGWILYELLAVAYAAVLPLAMVLWGIFRVLGLRLRFGRLGDHVGTLVLAVPFATIAWEHTPQGTGHGFALLGFALLAMGRWLPYQMRGGGALVRDGVSALVRCGAEAWWVWTLATLSFFLSVILILPLEPLLGLKMPSVDHGQIFMLLGMGLVYFVLNTLVHVFPVERWIATLRARREAAGRPRPITPAAAPAPWPRRRDGTEIGSVTR